MQTHFMMNRHIAAVIVPAVTVLLLVPCLALAQQSDAKNAAKPIDSTPTKAVAGIKDYGLKEYVRLSKDLPHSETNAWKLVCKIPYKCHFQPWVQVESPEGKEIRFNSSNPLVLYLTPAETVTTKAGEHAYEANNWVSGEGAIYTIPAGVTVKAVKYPETGYDTTFAGSFECNDNDYNILWKKAARTLERPRLNMHWALLRPQTRRPSSGYPKAPSPRSMPSR